MVLNYIANFCIVKKSWKICSKILYIADTILVVDHGLKPWDPFSTIFYCGCSVTVILRTMEKLRQL